MVPQQLSFSYPVRTARGYEDFLITPSNQDAVDWIDRWPDWQGHALVIYGPAGSGKTHLAHVWQQRADARLLTLADITNHDGPWDPTHYIIEDIDRMSLNDAAQAQLFHLYNWCREGGSSLLLTARLAPTQWPITLPDLSSRLRSLQTVALNDPEDELLSAVIVKMFSDRQVTISMDVLTYMLRHMDRTLLAAKELVAALDQRALNEKRKITIPLVKDVLKASVK